MQSLIEALNARDAYTRGHSQRVACYAAAIAAQLGMSLAQQRALRLGAHLHDVGKIGVPDDVLLKEGGLTAPEVELVLKHTLIGERILRPLLGRHRAVLATVRSHHERFDGMGYPEGLRGSSIPLEARIVAVADAFDAMTSTRPYRPKLPMGRAMRELERGAGAQFDPACVRAFLGVLGRWLRARTVAPRWFGGVLALPLADRPTGPVVASQLAHPPRWRAADSLHGTVAGTGGARSPPGAREATSGAHLPGANLTRKERGRVVVAGDPGRHRQCRPLQPSSSPPPTGPAGLPYPWRQPHH